MAEFSGWPTLSTQLEGISEMKRFAIVTVFAGGVTAIILAASNIGINLPKLATHNYVEEHARVNEAVQRVNDDVHEDLAGELKSFRETQLENVILSDERRAGDLEVTATQLRAVDPNAKVGHLLDLAAKLRQGVVGYDEELNRLRREELQ